GRSCGAWGGQTRGSRGRSACTRPPSAAGLPPHAEERPRRPVTRAPGTRRSTTMRSRTMNPHEHDHQHQPDPETRQAPTAENAGAPEAIGAADVIRHRGHEIPGQGVEGRRARGVDWVRPNDLLARGTGRMSRAAIDFNTHL